MSTHVLTTYNYNTNLGTSEGFDSKRTNLMTLRPNSGQIVSPSEIVTLQPQKVGRSVTVEHCVPLTFLVPTVCHTAFPIPPRFSRFSPWTLGFGRLFSLFRSVKKFLCVTQMNFSDIFLAPDMGSHT